MITTDQQAIRVIDQVLDQTLCDALIAGFEYDREYATEIPTRLIELDIFASKDPQKQQVREFDLARWKPLTDRVVDLLIPQVTEYRATWDPRLMLPDQFSLEGLRVKSYLPDVHEFKMHVDVTNRESSSRFIGCLFYLNDSDAPTVFPDHDLTIEAKAGRLVLFPPTWQYPHQGMMPQTHTKYIMSTYLHYGY